MIETSCLTKICMNRTILDNVSIAVDANTIYGIIGPNGSGKSTLLRIIAGASSATAGTIKINGSVRDRKHIDYSVAYIRDFPGIYDWMRPLEFLNFVCGINGIDTKNGATSKYALEAVLLNSATETSIKHFSRGMKQRLAIAQVLVSAPQIIIFDEPISGIDMLGKNDVITLLKDLRKTSTVLIASHDLTELGEICDKILFLNSGKVLFEKKTDEMSALLQMNILKLHLTKNETVYNISDIVRVHHAIIEVAQTGFDVSLSVLTISNNLLKAIVDFFYEKNVQIDGIYLTKPGLEEIFVSEVYNASRNG